MRINDSRTIINIEYAISKDPGGSCNFSVKNMLSIDFNGIFFTDFFKKYDKKWLKWAFRKIPSGYGPL